MDKRSGNVQVFLLAIIMIILFVILTAIFLLYIQINSSIFGIKNDMFYIAQNAYIAMDYEKLAYSCYEVDQDILKNKITQLLNLNYPNYTLIVNEIYYDYNCNSVHIDINIILKPIALKSIIGDISINVKDNIKLKLMEVK